MFCWLSIMSTLRNFSFRKYKTYQVFPQFFLMVEVAVIARYLWTTFTKSTNFAKNNLILFSSISVNLEISRRKFMRRSVIQKSPCNIVRWRTINDLLFVVVVLCHECWHRWRKRTWQAPTWGPSWVCWGGPWRWRTVGGSSRPVEECWARWCSAVVCSPQHVGSTSSETWRSPRDCTGAASAATNGSL